LKNTIIIKLTPRWFYKGLLDHLGLESKYYRGDAKRQLQREIDINCVLPHLDRAETEKYIQSHLNYAGVSDRELFSRRAVDEIFRMSCGIPRLINRICEKSLMCGCQQNLQVIDDQDVLYVSDHEMISGGDQL